MWRGLAASCDLDHWSDDVLVTELGKFAFTSGIVEGRHHGEKGRLSGSDRNCVRAIDCCLCGYKVVVSSPLSVNFRPFLFCELECLRIDAIVFNGSMFVSEVVCSGQLPISNQLAARVGIANIWDIRFRLNAEVCVPKFNTPFISRI